MLFEVRNSVLRRHVTGGTPRPVQAVRRCMHEIKLDGYWQIADREVKHVRLLNPRRDRFCKRRDFEFVSLGCSCNTVRELYPKRVVGTPEHAA
jgi:hypothetical protein